MTLSRYEHTGDAPATGLASGIGATDTAFTAISGSGYPTGANGKFVVCLDPNTIAEEKILCSSRSGATFTVAPGGRGYDNTTATSHGTGSTNITHVLSAAEIDDFSDHVYTTTRDDHTQYARADGTRAFTGAVTVNSGGAQVTGNSKVTGTLEVTQATTVDAGGLTVTAGGLTVAAGTTAVQAATVTGTLAVTGAVTGSSTVTGTALIPSGITGATAATRFVGGTASGSPASGTFALGDFVIDQTGEVWICTTAGTVGSGCVFTKAGPGGSAGGDLTGSYPNPTLDLTKTHVWTANQTAPALVASGLTGATAASRYAGATTGGAPGSGTWSVGDTVIDQTGAVWVDTSGGWVQAGVPTTLDGVAVGSTPAAGTRLHAYAGTFAVTTSSGGGWTHNFPTNFATGYNFTVSVGDNTANIASVVPILGNCNLGAINGLVYDKSGALINAQLVRINFYAVGA